MIAQFDSLIEECKSIGVKSSLIESVFDSNKYNILQRNIINMRSSEFIALLDTFPLTLFEFNICLIIHHNGFVAKFSGTDAMFDLLPPTEIHLQSLYNSPDKLASLCEKITHLIVECEDIYFLYFLWISFVFVQYSKIFPVCYQDFPF